MIIADETSLGRIASCWPLLLLIGFASPFIPLAPVLGYRWSVELAFAAFVLFSAILSLLVRERHETSKEEYGLVVMPLVLFIGCSFLSALWAQSWRAALHHSLLWSCYLCFFLLIRQTLDHKTKNTMLKFLGAILFAVGLSCVLEYLGGNVASGKAFNERYYYFAEGTIALIPIFIAVTLSSDRRWSRLALIVTAMAWAMVIATTSRAMFVAGSFGMGAFVILVLLTRRRFEKPKRLVVTLITLVAITLLFQVPFRSDEYSSIITRLTEADEYSALNTKSRLLMWGLAVEGFRSSPLVGIGADNYFSDYKTLRESYSSRDPSNPLLAINEDVFPERAHNEYLQILAELGLVGALLFAWLLVGIAYMFWLAFKKKASLITIGALSGMVAFLVASGASSYSFRFPSNGICFFFLLAIASRELFDWSAGVPPAMSAKHEEDHAARGVCGRDARASVGLLVPVFAIVVSVAMIAFCLFRANSIRHLTNAMNTEDEKRQTAEYENAIAIDPSEPIFRYYYSQRLAREGVYEAAAQQMRIAVDNGLANSTAFFRLAVAEQRAGRSENAEKTFQEALRVYPRSVFLRTAYAAFLKRKGDAMNAETHYNTALAINEKQARSWQLAHDEGLERLVQVSRVDPSYFSPFDLLPSDAPLALTQ